MVVKMSYNYSYKSSNSSGGAGVPRGTLSNDAEFQAAKMQAMMGGPVGGSGGGNRSYSYQSTSSSATPTTTLRTPGSSLEMDTEMARMKREMESSLQPSGSGSSSYSRSSQSSTGGGLTSPRTLHISQEPSKSNVGSTVKKVVTTTTTKTNPQAAREFESLERDFSRIGRAPDNYHDDFDKLKREIMTGEAYRGDAVVHHEPSTLLSTTPCVDSSLRGGIGSERTTTKTTRTYGSGQPMTEETVVKKSCKFRKK